MGKTERKKELLAAYKERPQVGGVCLVRNTATGRVWLMSCRDTAAQQNRFAFSSATNTPLLPAMGPDFAAYGADSFTFEVPEALEKKPEQTDKEFLADLEALEFLWRDRLTGEGAEFYGN